MLVRDDGETWVLLQTCSVELTNSWGGGASRGVFGVFSCLLSTLKYEKHSSLHLHDLFSLWFLHFDLEVKTQANCDVLTRA